jgi:hypothetical protein
MERGTLKLYFKEEIEGCGTVDADVAAGGYAGSSCALLNTAEIEAFAKAICEYPPASSGRCYLEGSRFDAGLSISVCPINSRGYLAVTVCLWANRQGLPMKIEVELVTAYEALAKFGRDLLSLIKNEIEMAVLEEEAVL